ncbi:predicted protein [Naegleria gruberi]|uniref:Predicted protein n=1 Tax=Naegleria gruberi TaxID=5762 RepID=D2VVU8_NAEGR|nr:uncharacterized protein NAEGRDRAFT_81420 [Naegleria gruberi]EFC39166.1 predicted protein [Naegleria gruberi]|eukprot:XP_002671910.1 predicted protein [Naegleria gruberi strain NEG-M]
MHVQALAVSFIILTLVSFLTAFDSFKLLESQMDQQGNNNYCCLPNVHSYNSSFNIVAINDVNQTLALSEGSSSFFGDYNLGKIRQSGSFSISGKVYSFTLWDFKVSETISVEYRVPFEGICSCVKVNTDPSKWQPSCVPKSGKITKGKIGQYNANRIEAVNKYGQDAEYWVFNDERIESGKCWILNVNTFTFTGNEQVVYYDQTEKVDADVFKVPSYCPTLEKCLAH